MAVDNLETIELLKNEGLKHIALNRDETQPHPGHETAHLLSVAQLADLGALAANLPTRWGELGFVSGLMHDIVRSPSESSDSMDEKLSAASAIRFMRRLDRDEIYPNTVEERLAVSDAIIAADSRPVHFDTKPNPKNWNTREGVLTTLYFGDKVEQNGYLIIARRPQFVGGARLKEPEPRDYGLNPDGDEVKAVLLENAIRLVYLNPETGYLPTFQEIVKPLYDVQRPFVHGLLNHSGMDIKSYAEFMLSTQSLVEPGKNYVTARKGLKYPADTQELAYLMESAGGLSNQGISETTGDIANSAVEAINYFSARERYQKDLGTLIQDWQPQGDKAKEWHQGMVDYISGKWYRETRAQLLAR